MYKYILFDLDGTLVDTNDLILKSFKHTYKKHLNRDIPEEEILKNFGEPLIITLERYSKEDAKEMFKTYIGYNEVIHDQHIKGFPGTKECLKELKELGCKLSIVTSKRKELAVRGLEIFDLLQYFDEIVALEDTVLHKPNPEPVLKALEKLNSLDKKNEALMVGDSKFDILSAANAGVKSVLVNWSLATEAQNTIEMKPDYIIDNLEKLIQIVKEDGNV